MGSPAAQIKPIDGPRISVARPHEVSISAQAKLEDQRVLDSRKPIENSRNQLSADAVAAPGFQARHALTQRQPRAHLRPDFAAPKRLSRI